MKLLTGSISRLVSKTLLFLVVYVGEVYEAMRSLISDMRNFINSLVGEVDFISQSFILRISLHLFFL